MKTKVIIIGFAIIAVGFIGWKIFRDDIKAAACTRNCSKSCEYEGKDYVKATSAIVEQPGAKIGEFTCCPLSKVVIKVSEESPSFTYKNKTYYTCCGTCAELVSKHPEKYLN